MQLTQQDIDQFRSSGFPVIRNLFSGSAQADLICRTDALEAWPETTGAAMTYFETAQGGTEKMTNMDVVPAPAAPGDPIFFESHAPHWSASNATTTPGGVLYITCHHLSEGDWREACYAGKRRSFPPDCERVPGRVYEYKV